MLTVALDICEDPGEVRKIHGDIYPRNVRVVVELPAVVSLSKEGERKKEEHAQSSLHSSI